MGVETENPAALTDPGVIVCPKCSKVLSEDQPYCPVDHAVTGGVRGVTAGTLAHTPRSKQHLLGVTIGDAYVINGYLGSGGFGAVYRAEQKALGRDVAIKVLLVDPEIDPAVIQRFKREARTSAALLDPNIVTLFDYGETSLSDAGEEKDHLLYFVMELVHGPTLRQFLKTLPNGVGLDHSLKLGINILRGLAAAHHMGVVHRDLKPGNVLIDESKGRKHFARLFDFGISSLQGSGGHTTKMGPEGGVVGTPKYMAPEQWRAQTTAPCTDVYAFGAMLVELLTGQPPIPKMELAEMAAAHCRGARPEVVKTGNGEPVPPALTAFIKKCMAIDPRQRYGSAKEALDVLTAIDESRERAPIPTFTRFPSPGTQGLDDPSLRSGMMAALTSGERASLGPPPFEAAPPPERLSLPLKVTGPPPVASVPVATAPVAPLRQTGERRATSTEEPIPIIEIIEEKPKQNAALWLIALALVVLAVGVVIYLLRDPPQPVAGPAGPASLGSTAPVSLAAAPASVADAAAPPPVDAAVPSLPVDAAAPSVPVDAAVPDAAAPPSVAPRSVASEPKKPKQIKVVEAPPSAPASVAAAPATAEPIQVAGVRIVPKANPNAADLAEAEADYEKGIDAQSRGAPKSAQKYFVEALSKGLSGGKAQDARRRIKQIVDRTTLEASEF